MAAANLDFEPYEAIRACLDLSRGALAVEVLPSQFVAGTGYSQALPILVDGSSICIPKRTLVRSFLVARKHLQKFSIAPLNSPEDAENTLQATFVALLFDPEHLTAANFRKRILSATRKDSKGDERQRSFLRAVQTELLLTETLVTSPLNRHTKSPTLWYHRRWVRQQWREFHRDDDGFRKSHDARWIWEHVCMADLLVVAKAGEQHPKNYYAWSYARWLVDYFTSDLEGTLASSLSDAIGFVQGWCLKHQSDISGWSFLLFLYSRAAKVTGASDTVQLGDTVLRSVEEILHYALSFNWDLESIWVFLRTALATPSLVPVDRRSGLMQKVKEKITRNEEDEVQGKGRHNGHNARFMQAALSWVEATS